MPFNSFDDYPLTWKPSILKEGQVPLHIEIAEKLEHDIRDGLLRPNTKLPPQRELADFLDVNLSTIAKAFKLCASKGLICGEAGRGTYVSSDVISNLPMLAEDGLNHCINLGASLPIPEQDKYTSHVLKQLLKKANIIGDIFAYPGTYGVDTYKKCGVKWLSRYKLNVKEDNILITAGLQNALSVTLAALFRYGDKIATNAVIYPGFKNIANTLGIRLVPIPYVDQNLDVSSLKRICVNDTIKGIYLIPDHHNPTTIYMSYEERAAVADIARKFNLICIEDSSFSFLSPEPHMPITALIPERSIYISSVSNSLSPGFRIAFVYVPTAYIEIMFTTHANVNVMAPPLEAELVSQLINSGMAEQIIEEKREELIKRNTLIDLYLSKYYMLGDSNSQFRWLHLPRKWSSANFERAAKERGVQIFGSQRFVVGNASVFPAARIAISSPRNVALLERGLDILATLLH
ncbi:PLP-dependent aminotransferase family protein [uncultured Dysosmobacter sp.]|uniref:aminotransferase-like domain-containing protein n=1 Tax=uncultured Dysosmobacter sp. TaxID=2591384 RepID=UPI002618527C|nr:PLP-dependent aminotransferase family protein [uncultured Dysosmobacter sp.]